jgi:hypothetical protein
VDFLTKKTKVNEGEVPQYYVENSHPAIVDKETFELVQAEIRRRQTHGKHLSGSGLFFGKIICGECGGFYGSKVWHSADKYRRVVWQCNHKYMKGTRCTTPHITEEYVRECFVVAFNQLVGRKERYVAEYVAAIEGLGDSAVVDGQIKRLISESEEIAEQIEDCIAQNTRVAQNQGEYQRRYDALVARFDEVKRQSENLLLRKGRMPHGGKSCGGLWEC